MKQGVGRFLTVSLSVIVFCLFVGCGKADPQAVSSTSTPGPSTIHINFTGFAGGHNDSISSIAYDSGSGRTYVAGFSYDASGNRRAFIARYTNLGVIDNTFNGGTGYVLSPAGGFASGNWDNFQSIAIDGVGGLIVGGSTRDATSRYQTLLARYTSAGALDTGGGFNGATGYILGPAPGFAGGSRDHFNAIAIHPGGNIYCAGTSRDSTGTQRTILARYTSAGALDTGAFNGANGYILGPLAGFAGGNTDTLTSIRVEAATGKAVVAGTSITGAGDLRSLVARYTNAGALDTATFNAPSGFVLGPVLGFGGGRYDVLNGLELDGGNNIFAAGFTYDVFRYGRILATKYTAAGALDTAAFNNPNGYYVGPSPGLAGGRNDIINSVSLDPVTGRLLIAGSSHDGAQDRYLIARYTAAGLIDGTFNAVGYVAGTISNSGYTGNAVISSVFVDAIQRVWVAGTTTYINGYQEPFLMRFLSNGTRDF